MVFGQEKVKLGMEVLAAMDSNLQFLVDDVLAELENASFGLLVVASIVHLLHEIMGISLANLLLVYLSEKEF